MLRHIKETKERLSNETLASNPQTHAAAQERENKFNKSFIFAHNQMNTYPGHNKQYKNTNQNPPYHAHNDSVEEMIQFIDEYCLYNFVDHNRKIYINGFNCAQMSYVDPRRLRYCFQKPDEHFVAGIEEGKQACTKRYI